MLFCNALSRQLIHISALEHLMWIVNDSSTFHIRTDTMHEFIHTETKIYKSIHSTSNGRNSNNFSVFLFIWLEQKTTGSNIILICTRVGDDEIQSFQQHLNRIAAEKLLLKWGDYWEHRLIVGNGLWTRHRQSQSIAQMKIT